jgi:PPOX class probable F420-dependent enzyme
MSRRDKIKMSDEEVSAFLDEQRTVTCATNGKDGFPHLMPLWYVVGEDGVMQAWTYARSQKVRNLERDPHATLQVEAGEEYQELRGVMFKCDVEIIRETERVAEVGLAIFTRYAGGGDPDNLDDAVREMVSKQASKRVALRFTERERATWDHRKLGAGVY